jgi:ATP-binding cassette, subfamily B, bacterial AbcA/BmrA
MSDEQRAFRISRPARSGEPLPPGGTPVSLRRFWGLIRRTKPPMAVFTIALFVSTAATLVGLLVPLIMKNLVDGFSHASFDMSHIPLIAGAFAAQALCAGLSLYLLTWVGQRIVAGLRGLLWKKQLALTVPFFDATDTGELVSRMNNDTAVLKTLVAENVSGFLTGLISIIGAVIILITTDWRMTLVMLGALPLAAGVMVPLGRLMRRVSQGMMNENASFTTVLSRALSEIRLVKASNAESREYERGRKAIDGLFRFGVREGKVMSLISPLMSLVMMGILVAIIGYGGVRISSGAMSAGQLVAFILYLIQIIVPISQVTGFLTQLQKARGATQSIMTILDQPEERTHDGRELSGEGEPLHGRNLHFAYKADEPVIRGVSFDLSPGTVTALVGPSGSGKTTVFSLMERFYEPDSGTITIGDTPIQDVSLGVWRARIGYVSQDSPLMAGSIRDNIMYGVDREASAEEIEHVAELAYAHDFITRLPHGYETEVGERGVKLSGGQRQRIAIARALMRNPGLLMLDEATSSLDSTSEMSVQNALGNLMRGRTTLVIAHRLSTVMDADQILFLDKGLITGRGTHDELLKTHPLYRTFAAQQFRIPGLLAEVPTPAVLEALG